MHLPRKIRIAVNPSPNVFEIIDNKTENQQFSGYEGKFLNAILSGLGYRYEAVVTEDGEFGRLKSDGNWTGMIGMVHRGEADLGFTTIAITEQRFGVVEYSTTYEKLSPSFAVKKPGVLRPMFAYVYPFNMTVWICIIAVLFIMTIAFVKISNREESYGRIFYNLFGSFFGQAISAKKDSTSFKILFCNWLIVITVIPVSYSAALLSFLTVPIYGIPIRTYEELSAAVQKGTHRCYALRGTSTIAYLRNSPKNHLQMLGNEINSHEWYITDWDIMSGKYLTDDSAILSNTKKLHLFYGTKQDFIITKDTLTSWPSAFAVRKNFCCKARLNSIISRLVSAGIYGKFLRDESVKFRITHSDNVPEDQVIKKLSVKDLAGIFLILGIGLSLALVSFLVEVVHHRLKIINN
ncbi:glutamate receptor ionotropic, delta-1 [Nephila pilipes]|uniref:Glutamate receptor ionotropic, delta-1 n=1 Tax=Nephila pilipes TaxID=299642 RepID=A0A8X6Q3K6_NEPPI|nr:glutamate receptor ionotropic, delta-1 [Nephila pilipes]